MIHIENDDFLEKPVKTVIESSEIKSASLLKGFSTLFMTYYVFHIQYSKDVSKTLEFIQKLVLKIGPSLKKISNPVNNAVNKLRV